MKPKYLLLILPRSGLCNKIIIWANALVWCHKNNARLIVRRWFHLPFGTLLRSEYRNRNYRNFLKKSKISLTKLLKFKSDCPVITSAETPLIKNRNYFKYKGKAYILDLPKLADYRELILSDFYKIINPDIKKKAATYSAPTLGVHIRKGDFKKIGFDVELTYYIKVIKSIFARLKKKPEVMVFSDANPTELEEILELENLKLFSSGNDLVDLLVLSKSRILVTSYESSYSYWAAFMSDGVVIHHPKAETVKTRPDAINRKNYEGKFPETHSWPELLRSNLKAINQQNLKTL